MTTRKTNHSTIADLSTAQLTARAEKIGRHLDAIEALMADAVELTDAERKASLRLQGDEEVAALDGVLGFADARPELFTDLADEDNGHDPTRFETSLLRERLANAQVLASLTSRIEQTSSLFSDSATYVTTLAKRPALAAYEIAKPYQQRDRKNGRLLNDAVNLYHARAVASARTRAAHRAVSATPQIAK
jgi:hypothetical protein